MHASPARGFRGRVVVGAAQPARSGQTPATSAAAGTRPRLACGWGRGCALPAGAPATPSLRDGFVYGRPLRNDGDGAAHRVLIITGLHPERVDGPPPPPAPTHRHHQNQTRLRAQVRSRRGRTSRRHWLEREPATRHTTGSACPRRLSTACSTPLLYSCSSGTNSADSSRSASTTAGRIQEGGGWGEGVREVSRLVFRA